jgi:hypothetical protein
MTPSAHNLSRVVVSVKRPEAYSDLISKPLVYWELAETISGPATDSCGKVRRLRGVNRYGCQVRGDVSGPADRDWVPASAWRNAAASEAGNAAL